MTRNIKPFVGDMVKAEHRETVIRDAYPDGNVDKRVKRIIKDGASIKLVVGDDADYDDDTMYGVEL